MTGVASGPGMDWPDMRRRYERALLLMDSSDMPTHEFRYSYNREYILAGYTHNGEMNVAWRHRPDALDAVNQYFARNLEQPASSLEEITTRSARKASVQVSKGAHYGRDHDEISVRVLVPTQLLSVAKLIVESIDTQMPVTQDEIKDVLVTAYKFGSQQERRSPG